ncbi:MAG: transposase [Chloroflexi bacterium]|nr:transposase [Chloroflexota bacterium]
MPRHTERSRALYSSRGAVEREFGRLKHEWSLLPLRVRGIERVRLHADLTILAKLGCSLAKNESGGRGGLTVGGIACGRGRSVRQHPLLRRQPRRAPTARPRRVH